MPETDGQRERRLIEEAEKRARESVRIEARLDTLDAQVNSIRNQMSDLRAVRSEVSDLRSEFKQSLAVAAARALDAKELAVKQVTSRELYLSAIGVTVAIISALAAGGVFH